MHNPENTKIIVFTNGIVNGDKPHNPSGIQKPPTKIVGSTLHQKNPQKNPKKNKTSDNINNNIPIFKLETNCNVCLPKKTLSSKRLLNHP